MNVDKIMHQAHLRYQRQMMRPETVSLPSSEIRGVRDDRRYHIKDVVWLPEWSSHLRPNFWKAYFDTLSYFSK